MATGNTAQITQWDYQVRINLVDSFAAVARINPGDSSLKPLNDVLARYNAVIKNQFDAFADFCKAAEASGTTDSDLYIWTKKTVDDPAKQMRYATRFTVYADGGKEVYDKAIADGLEADLQPLMGSMLTKIDKFDSNPARNPQPPRQP
ncbi:MAG: hypothetical protein NDJ24_07370 [Alphaproteobacteria bacterium]|nr:hypothetical protein [Alphaproteobacteria bacterium]